MLYLDTSCLLKLFFVEAETQRTLEIVAGERRVLVSSLARLEADVQVQARVAGGLLKTPAGTKLLHRIDSVLGSEPYEPVPTPQTVFEVATRQIRPLQKKSYCRILDRLHLATMEALRVGRLLTNDDRQAAAARALGFEVVVPR